MKGKIIKGIGGFYYVKTADGLIECKARGKFRHRDMKPLVGDDVEIVVEFLQLRIQILIMIY